MGTTPTPQPSRSPQAHRSPPTDRARSRGQSSRVRARARRPRARDPERYRPKESSAIPGVLRMDPPRSLAPSLRDLDGAALPFLDPRWLPFLYRRAPVPTCKGFLFAPFDPEADLDWTSGRVARHRRGRPTTRAHDRPCTLRAVPEERFAQIPRVTVSRLEFARGRDLARPCRS